MRALEKLTPADQAVVRREVRRLLTNSPAFARLSAEQGERVGDRITDVVAFLSHGAGKARAGKARGAATRVQVEREFRGSGAQAHGALVDAVDFPEFVAGLIAGVFGAIVDASIQQMEAYASLLAELAGSLDEFVSESEPKLERERQQQLATMVLMGINRIVVTDGSIRPEADDDDDDDP